MKILVTGASGYVGSRLVPRLLEEGHEIRTTTMAEESEKSWWADRVETVTMDIADADQVRAACAGVDAVYYLIHGMGGDDFRQKDREGAQHMAAGVAAHSVSRVVYLSGIVPPVEPDQLSEHLTSRLEVEEILSATSATTITLRAAVLLGSGSTSFEIVRQVSERLPVQTVPDWMRSQVQPIAVVDMIEALVGALTAPGPSRHYDVGGPDRMAYPDLLDAYAQIAGLTRPQVTVPLLPTQLVGSLVGALTDVPTPVVQALVESLHEDMVAAEDTFTRDLLPPGYRLLGVEESIRRALARPVDQDPVDPATADPMGPLPQDPSWASGGDDRPVLAKGVDAIKDVLPGDQG